MVNKELALYFERIGLAIPSSPTLDSLKKICRYHTRSIPFENIDPVIGVPIHLDSFSLKQKLLIEKRGGYCFEHCTLLLEVLEGIGYKVRGITGRPVTNYKKKAVSTRTHMALIVSIDKVPYLVDVGYGALTPTEPLKLELNTPQDTALGSYKFTQIGEDLLLHVFVQNHWKVLYIFDLREQTVADFQVASWYISNHPDSYYSSNLMVSIVKEGAHYALNKNRLTSYSLADNTKEKRLLKTPLAIIEALRNLFQLPEEEVDSPRLNKYIHNLFEKKENSLKTHLENRRQIL